MEPLSALRYVDLTDLTNSTPHGKWWLKTDQENIEDVDEDDVLIIDGLTKRFRLPGWRVAWILGPKEFIKALVPTVSTGGCWC